MTLCKICLRTGRRTLAGNRQIMEFYADITNNPISIPTYFCIECDYLLKKFIKFKEKCEKASEVFASWQSGVISEDLKNLHKMLPPSPLDIWIANASRICTFTLTEVTVKQEPSYPDEDSIPDNATAEAAVKDEQENLNSVIENLEDVSQDNKTIEIVEEYENVEDLDDGSFFEPEPIIVKKKDVALKLEKKKSRKLGKFQKHIFVSCIKRNKQFENVFDIEHLLTTKLKIEEFERRKTYECYLKAEHKCNICYDTFRIKKFADLHMNTYHNENNTAGREKCPICSMWVVKLKKKHMPMHSFAFKCKLCPLVTYYRTSMMNHYQKHMGTKYHCDICNTDYKSVSAYKSHKYLHLNTNPELVSHACTTCGRGFSSQQGLDLHCKKNVACQKSRERAELSLPEDVVRCEECQVTFATEQAYRVHESQIHKIRQARICSLHCKACDIKYFKKAEFYKHLAEVHNEIREDKPREKGRNKHFGVKPQKRKFTYSPAKYTCRLCNKNGVGVGWLQRHFKKDHPAENVDAVYADQKTHLCHQCGAAFTNYYHLRYHLLRHEQHRPFVCDQCPKRFRSLTYARVHRRKKHQHLE